MSDVQQMRVSQPSTDDLAVLHAMLGHHARQLWDLQKQRVAAGNRVDAMERDGLGKHAEPARLIVAQYDAMEKAIDRELTRLVKQHFMRDWIEAQRGIGLPGFARLLGVAGDISRFPTVSKLWKYLGLHVVDGHAPRREKGVPWTHTDCTYGHLSTCKPECTTDHHPNCGPGIPGTAYSPQGRVVCRQIADSIVKLGGHKEPCPDDCEKAHRHRTMGCPADCPVDHAGPYRRAYDDKKAQYLARQARSGPSGCPMGQTHRSKTGHIIACVKEKNGKETSDHLHSAAMRYAIKELTKALWVEWHARRGQCAIDTHNRHAAPPPILVAV